MSFTALSVIVVALLFLAEPIHRIADSWARVPPSLLFPALLATLTLPYIPLIKCGGLRMGHLTHLFLYPPAWVAALVAAGVLFLVRGRLSDLDIPFSSTTHLFAILLWIASPTLLLLIIWLRERLEFVTADTSPHSSHSRDFSLDFERDFHDWLEKEAPIIHPSDDRFDRARIAERIARRLTEPCLGRIGLLGPFGGGKSSILRMVEHYLHDDDAFRTDAARRWHEVHSGESSMPNILTCRVDAWSIDKTSVPAVVLRRAIDTLADHVDCLAVSNLPSSYMNALHASGPSWIKVPLAISTQGDPTEQIRRLQPLLLAINARLVIFIEDLDRNSDSAAFEVSHDVNNDIPNGNVDITTEIVAPNRGSVFRDIEAMLDRLQDVECVSFVLAISQAGP